MKNICIDARMLGSSGIGTYLRNILPFIVKKYAPKIILKTEDIIKLPFVPKELIIESNHHIYSVKEQFFFQKL